MLRVAAAAAVAALLPVAAAERPHAARPGPDDGRIVASAPCAPMPPWSAAGGAGAVGAVGAAGDSAAYERLRRRVVCRRLTYLVDGLRVVAYEYRPRDADTTGARRLPVIVVSRGGNRELGRLPARLPRYLYGIAGEDAVILATQYRGTDGGEGREEYGGADVRDVLALFPLAATLPYADTENAFLLGYSRGGMMTYLALKHGAPVRAAAVWAGPTDLVAQAAWRADLDAVFRELVPGYPADTAPLRERSALHWAERIRVPVLILHGTADDRVRADDAVRLAARLRALGRPHELVLYEGDDHRLSRNGDDADRRILRWFRAHRR